MHILKSIYHLSLLSGVLLFASCQSKQGPTRDKSNLTTPTIQKVDEAHKVSDFLSHECVSFDLNLIFGGKEAFKGRVYTMTNSSAIRLDYADGKKLLLNNDEIYTYAEPIPTRKISDRFALFTWQYFFMAPFKLGDPGTNWEEIPEIRMSDNNYASQMLTFDEGTGDGPNDYYIMHPHPTTNLLAHMGYIVTAGSTDIRKAESNAHAISYQDYKEIEGIPFSHKWIFSDYVKGLGLGKQIGEATVSNIKLEDAGSIFDPASDILYLKYD